MSAGRRRPSSGRGQWSGGFPPPSRPRDVKGGIVARSARGDIGEQWWSRRFITVLESFALGSRMTRGKNYARRGQVISLQVEPGVVSAKVQGSRKTPYRVTIGLAPFGELVWAKAEIVLAEQAIHSAALLAGEFPAELEEVFGDAGAPLFPRRASDMQMNCSCPDREVPCKHLAATFYLLAESFDQDPFLILQWRGRARADLLDRLRGLRGDASVAQAAPTAASGHRAIGAVTALADLVGVDPGGSREGSIDPTAFWSAGALPALPVHSVLPPDMLLRQLPVPSASLGGPNMVEKLRALYERMSAGGDE